MRGRVPRRHRALSRPAAGWRNPAGVLATLLVAATAAPATAQVPTLQRVDSLITAGDYETARSDLQRWWSGREQFDVPGSDMARALMLRARLAPDPVTAEPDYLAVVLGYPTSDYAADALLRLGQGLLATGDAPRAAAYLERLVADHPGRTDRPVALLWLARARNAARAPAAACQAARAGLEDTSEPDLAEMLRVEAAASCGFASEQGGETTRAADDQPAGTRAAETPPAEPSADRSQPVSRPETGPIEPSAATGDWAAQTGAFRYRDGAEALMERLRTAGYSPRLVRVPGSELLRVRVGRFTTAGEARALVSTLKGRGFDAVPVRDAARERQP